MSGGVDSSVAAAILKDQGHEVIGITLQLYDYGLTIGKKGACCAGQDIYDASVAADRIGIPHYVLNYESVFKQEVIDDFAKSYLMGETPIPCVRCNQKVKFHDLFKVSKELGADALATGHYVQKITRDGISEMHKAMDESKDQSYFLFTTTKEQLDYLIFPVGGMLKKDTRELATHYKLNIADKPDSQDICFVPNGDYSAVIQKTHPNAFMPGEIIFKDGTVLGKHDGIVNFTIGQRKGIGIAYSEPLYVTKINPEKNQIIVGTVGDLKSNKLKIKELNWLGNPTLLSKPFECKVKLRSMHTPILATIEYLGEGEAVVNLGEYYKGIAPGQACVIYDNTRLLGGGWIQREIT